MKSIFNSERTLVMGILNVTPDSFSDGGLYLDAKKALDRAEEMIKEGADIIDIGGESTRPGSESVSEDEELKRVLPVIKLIREKLGQDILISIDTYKSKVAEECLRAGANMINSLGGFTFDAGLADVIVKYHCPIVLYHIKGQGTILHPALQPNGILRPAKQDVVSRPATQSSGIVYEDIISEIKDFFNAQIEIGAKKGMHAHDFILDPGIGFGKNVEHNLEIIRKFEEFQTFGMPLVVGVSRKSHLGAILKEELGLKEAPVPQERVEAGLAEVGVAVLKGASIVRTHDVLATKKFLAVLDKLK